MKFFMTICLTLFAAVSADSHYSSCRHHGSSPVKTTSGDIVGHAAVNRTQVSEYLGIPYASPPVGSLRFAAPEPFSSKQSLNASAYSPDCPANVSPTYTFPNLTTLGQRIASKFADQAGNHTQSEDCLTLNIWTKTSSRKSRKPVLLWIHGGRFTIPGSNNPIYNGQYLADNEDVVIVTFNYRVGIFGFPGSPATTQNVGLLDQRLAVEWVHNNIAGFGGDPDRITIFGQSAGGVSVDYYSFAWTADPIVHGLISHSGTALSMTPNSPEMSALYFHNVSVTLGCGGVSDSQALECVRTKDFRDVLKAALLVLYAPSKALPQPVFHPTVDNKTVFADYASLAAAGKFAKLVSAVWIPYLAGNLDYEAGYYKISAYAAKKNLTASEWDLFNLAGFTCPTGTEAANRARYNVPVWRYRYLGTWPNLQLYPTSGAYHGSELEMVFGTAEDVSGLPNTATENAVSRYTMKAWATFAAAPAHGLSGLGWPLYEPE
ncbi:hypothetical protein LTR39_003470, partial [Cryomyces antarcticus]